MPRIAIGLPTNRRVKAKTLQSLLEMIAFTDADMEIIVSTRGYNTAENRSYIAAQAVNAGCTHLFHVDDDMIYPKDTLVKLLAHDKDIVGGLYKTKYETQDYVMEGELKNSMFTCNAIGTGLLLVKTDVFKNIPQPWYGYKWHDNGMVKMSMDWYFCEKAREKGYEIWCDPDVTAGHIGKKTF